MQTRSESNQKEFDSEAKDWLTARIFKPPVLMALIVIIWLVLWQSTYSLFNLSPVTTSSPILILRALASIIINGTYHDSPNVYSSLEATLQATIVAFLLNLVIGFSLGATFGFSPYVGRAFEPVILVLQAFPIVVLFPVIVLIAGISIMAKVMLAILIGLPYLIFNVASAIRSVNQGYYLLGRSIGFSRWSNFRKIVVPDGAPLFLQGLRLCFTFTYVGVVVAEIIYVSTGLGYLLYWSSAKFYIDDLFAFIVIIIAIGAIADTLFSLAERRLLGWNAS